MNEDQNNTQQPAADQTQAQAPVAPAEAATPAEAPAAEAQASMPEEPKA